MVVFFFNSVSFYQIQVLFQKDVPCDRYTLIKYFCRKLKGLTYRNLPQDLDCIIYTLLIPSGHIQICTYTNIQTSKQWFTGVSRNIIPEIFCKILTKTPTKESFYGKITVFWRNSTEWLLLYKYLHSVSAFLWLIIWIILL